MQDIDIKLIKKSAGGNLEAFERIYKIASPYIYTIVYQITHNEEDAQDVTQEVFIKVYKNLSSFNFKSSFKTWIYKVALNTALNTVKKRTRDTRKMEEYNDAAKGTSFHSDADPVNSDDNDCTIEGILKGLNTDQRTCILLREVEGLSYKEIAYALNININTVRSRLKRARLALAASYGRRII